MCFFGKSSQKSSLFDILERKEYVLDRNSKFWKKSKKSKILKGLVHGFTCILGKSSHKRSLYDILDRREWFLDRNSSLKQVQKI